ncbi:MAG: GAF domain-containing protein [Candidatus Schekmanbacteria bacterium]|nr:GAF domain-containing protein [Candidatus Schekmanbacteria bacterium]
MYEIKKLIDRQESLFLLEKLSKLFTSDSWLGITDPAGNVIVQNTQLTRSLPLITPGADNSFFEIDGFISTPLISGDAVLGNLLAENRPNSQALLETAAALIIKQINNKIEKKELLRETLDTYKEINLLYNIGESLGHCPDVEQLAQIILQEIQKTIKSENCSLMLLDEKTEQLKIKSAIGVKSVHPLKIKPGLGIAGNVVQQAKTIICNDTWQDKLFIRGEKEIRSLLCAPLKTRNKVLGVINFSNKLDGKIFTARDAKLLSALSNQAANFIESILRHEYKLYEDRLIRNLERYLSPHIVKNLLKDNHELKLGGGKKKVTILFADIRNFSTLSEEIAPETLVKFLNEYFTHMVDIIFKNGGAVDKFVGDEIMAIFGAPITQGNDDVRAIKTAIEMQRKMQQLRALWQQKGLKPFSIGIGINSGEVIAGNIGSKKHMDYTVIGDAVNIAKRLESQAKADKILTSRNLYDAAGNIYRFKEFGNVMVKGKKNPVNVFEIIY